MTKEHDTKRELLECLIELTAAAEAADCGSRELLERCRKAIAMAQGEDGCSK